MDQNDQGRRQRVNPLYKDFFQHSLLRRWIVLDELQLPMSHAKFHHFT